MNDHDLDNLLLDALQGDPPAAQVERLERFWRVRVAADRRRRNLRSAALAACLMVMAGAAISFTLSPDRKGPPQQAESELPRPIDVPAKPLQRSVANATRGPAARAPQAPPRLDIQPEPGVKLAGRPATAYETLMFRMSAARSAGRERAVAVQAIDAVLEDLESRVGVAGLSLAAPGADAVLQSAIMRRLLSAGDEAALRGFLSLVANDRTRTAALAAAATVQNPPVATLLGLLRDERRSVRTSAAMALGRINGPQVSAALIKLVTEQSDAPNEAWIALLACRGESADSFLAAASQQPRMLNHVNHARIFWLTMQ
jgi:hypothetical protein